MSESLVIWSAALGLTGAIVLGYVATHWRRERHDRERLDEARRLGIDTPKGQYPFIDPNHCIGCGGCVGACPEGDVLGMVGGLATVVDGVRCIGIGQCALACPVGAITIRIGPLADRADVPRLDEYRETNVSDLWVVGELGGLALIRNAVEQGRDTVREIARRLDERPAAAQEVLDLAIVGAGPSGLSAALAAVEHRLSHVVLEQEPSLGGTIYHYPRQKLTHTQPVELPLLGALTRGEYSKEELLELFSTSVERHRVELRLGERVMALERSNGHFEIRTGTGRHRARHVVLALGRRGTPRKLGIPGEGLPKVMYQVRDAAQYRHREVLCIGGGDSAIEAAMGLARQPGNRVTLSYRKERFFRIKKKNEERLGKLISRRKIRLILESQPLEITPESVRLSTREGELTLANDHVFVLIGGVPPLGLLKESGVEFGGSGA